MLRNLLNDEAGAVISSELVLVLTILVLSLVVGLTEVAVAVNNELNDISNAIGSVKQDYAFTGFKSGDGVAGKAVSSFAGSGFDDKTDDCDSNTTCELVCSTTGVVGAEQ